MHLAVENLERRLLFALTITPREQELLEMLNRMRTNPQAEYNILTQTKNKDVLDAINFFGVNLTVLKQQFDALTPVQPLAWDASLRGAALGHSQAMITADSQTHQAPGELDLAARIKAAGYTNMSVAGENVFAFADSMFHAHASFAIDWGNDTNGIQNPPGHRDNMMDPDFREVGMGILDVTATGKSVGPIVVTQDFGNRYHFGNSWFLGVVYNDANADGQYNAGEGIAGASITLSGSAGTFTTTSMAAGGYQVQVPAGTYSVSASSAALGGTVTLPSVTMGSQNVMRDFTPTLVQYAHLNAGVLTISGTSGNDVTTVTQSGTTLKVVRNGVTETFDATKVSQMYIYGVDGNDKIDFSTVNIPTYVDAGPGNDLVLGGGANDTITGGAGKDTLYGGPGDDRLNGNGSPDHLYGQDGNDRLYGGDGDDVLDGGGGVDRLFGGNDNDVLYGGSSNDKLYGEAGNDTLFGQKQADLMDGGAGIDSAQKDALDTLVSIESIIA
jgi:Ca2+-binding RTX toxin-like protein